MTGILWRKALAIGTGTSLAMLTFAVLMPALRAGTLAIYSPGNLLRIRNQFRVEKLRPQAGVHRERVRASWNAGTAPSWSGSYQHTDGFESCHLDLGGEGFYYQADCCTGTTELAWGKIASLEGTLVRLEIEEHVIVERPDRSGDRRQRFRFSTDLYVVPWGEEHFLVPAELMTEFCSLANAGGWDSMTHADYPRRIEVDESVWARPRIEGLPEVPAEFRAYLPE